MLNVNPWKDVSQFCVNNIFACEYDSGETRLVPKYFDRKGYIKLREDSEVNILTLNGYSNINMQTSFNAFFTKSFKC